MDPQTIAIINLIAALLPAAETVMFKIGEQIVSLNTANMTDPKAIQDALQKASAEGFPVLQFKSTTEG